MFFLVLVDVVCYSRLFYFNNLSLTRKDFLDILFLFEFGQVDLASHGEASQSFDHD